MFFNILLTSFYLASVAFVYASKNQPPTYQLNDGRRMPSLGLGTWFGISNLTIINPVDEEASERAVGWAIDAGYRLFDTAYIYGTEKTVGRGVKRKISEGVIKREDVFISTKLWSDSHAREAVVPALRKSLEALGLDYVDLFLIHFPIGQFANGTFDLTDYTETWEGMVEARRRGLTRSIGVSNFNAHMMDRLIKSSCIKPAVAQIEVNLNIQQPLLLRYCCEKDITVMGYTPFGSVFPDRALPGAPGPRVDDPLLRQIAATHNKTVPQIILRYLIDLGVIPIPKSITKSRIEENIDIFDFGLSPKERIALGGFDVNYRSGKSWSDSPYYLTREFTTV
ncbi:PREDICTED: aldo-keto reductase AKR2E4-like [Papilio xuthus]|uniref:Aldo-keto reductase AKR2E4-like n=1 Tax=Papilio xuthus TaxID=66420 RepID=A0AAJ6ZNB4_PAPXU|nr:PREDICTED: aldo-keto reductase AKR2E4-like [Papilio xuthus]